MPKGQILRAGQGIAMPGKYWSILTLRIFSPTERILYLGHQPPERSSDGQPKMNSFPSTQCDTDNS